LRRGSSADLAVLAGSVAGDDRRFGLPSQEAARTKNRKGETAKKWKGNDDLKAPEMTVQLLTHEKDLKSTTRNDYVTDDYITYICTAFYLSG